MEAKRGNQILVTGVAGFIGFHLAKALLEQSYEVIGLDNLCEYYDVQLKRNRLALLLESENFYFYGQDLIDEGDLFALLAEHLPSVVVHLAAQPGVQHSLKDPLCCLQSNVIGFMNLLECCRLLPVSHLLFASSSSVYGENREEMNSTKSSAEHPLSIYAATKKANEMMAHCYSHLYKIPVTGLRLFTVYGPWGRPDMDYYSFTEDLFAGREIEVHGKHQRDFTYVDDVVEAIIRLIPLAPKENTDWNVEMGSLSESSAPYKIYNVGSQHSISEDDLIVELEEATGILAITKHLPMEPGEVTRTCADISELKEAIGYWPQTKLSDGILKFVAWYQSYYKI